LNSRKNPPPPPKISPPEYKPPNPNRTKPFNYNPPPPNVIPWAYNKYDSGMISDDTNYRIILSEHCTHNNNGLINHNRVPYKNNQANCVVSNEPIKKFDCTITVFVVLQSLYCACISWEHANRIYKEVQFLHLAPTFPLL